MLQHRICDTAREMIPTYDREEVRVVNGTLLARRLLDASTRHYGGNSETEVGTEHVYKHGTADVDRLSLKVDSLINKHMPLISIIYFAMKSYLYLYKWSVVHCYITIRSRKYDSRQFQIVYFQLNA